jgi:hypothetical protein
VPEALFLGVGLDEAHQLRRPSGEPQVAQCLVVDREHRDGRAVLGRHVAERGPVLERDLANAWAEELDELADDAPPA